MLKDYIFKTPGFEKFSGLSRNRSLVRTNRIFSGSLRGNCKDDDNDDDDDDNDNEGKRQHGGRHGANESL